MKTPGRQCEKSRTPDRGKFRENPKTAYALFAFEKIRFYKETSKVSETSAIIMGFSNAYLTVAVTLAYLLRGTALRPRRLEYNNNTHV
jgi:hypothetical protein